MTQVKTPEWLNVLNSFAENTAIDWDEIDYTIIKIRKSLTIDDLIIAIAWQEQNQTLKHVQILLVVLMQTLVLRPAFMKEVRLRHSINNFIESTLIFQSDLRFRTEMKALAALLRSIN